MNPEREIELWKKLVGDLTLEKYMAIYERDIFYECLLKIIDAQNDQDIGKTIEIAEIAISDLGYPTDISKDQSCW